MALAQPMDVTGKVHQLISNIPAKNSDSEIKASVQSSESETDTPACQAFKKLEFVLWYHEEILSVIEDESLPPHMVAKEKLEEAMEILAGLG